MYILLEIINNYSELLLKKPQPSDSEKFSEDVLDEIEQIDNFIESEKALKSNDFLLTMKYKDFF